MQTTEAVALTKWCPFSRVYAFAASTPQALPPTSTGGPANRWITDGVADTVPENARCIGSQCMAWMWTGEAWRDEDRNGCCGLVHRLV